MNCHQATERFSDYLLENLDEAANSEMQAHLTGCATCREEAESLRAIWTKLGTLPVEQPSETLRPRFYAMLEAYQHGMEQAQAHPRLRDVVNSWLERWWPRQPAFQFGLALLFLAIGLFVGHRLNTPVVRESGEIVALRGELHSMRELVTLTLLRQQSPSERLQGVSWVQRVDQPNEELLSTLLSMLDHDPNVNVRLAAVDALYLFAGKSQVRQGLVQSLPRQTSPLVQIALIDLIVELRENRAKNALEQLIKREKINVEVKQRAEWGMQQLL